MVVPRVVSMVEWSAALTALRLAAMKAYRTAGQRVAQSADWMVG
jgi:hypothetical protein